MNTSKQFKTNYKKFEKKAVKEFRKFYSDYDNVKTKDLSISEDGYIWIGNIQFPIDTKLSDFIN